MIRQGALRFYSGKNWASWIYPGEIVTALHDGAITVGVAPNTVEFRQSANFLGYGEDIYQHMVEHDLLHMIVAEELGEKTSGAMWYQAHNPDRAWEGPMPPKGKLEEQRLTAVQLMLNNIDPLSTENTWAEIGYCDLRKRMLDHPVNWVAKIRQRLRWPCPMSTLWAEAASHPLT